MPRIVLGHSQAYAENFETSALDFYALVEAAVRQREIPEIVFSSIEWKEEGLLSGKRTYLRVSRRNLSYDICAAPFGRSYFFSSWLIRMVHPSYDFILLGALAVIAIILSIFAAVFIRLVGGGGCIFFLGIPFVLVALLFGAGIAIRFGPYPKWQEIVLSMPYTGMLYRGLFQPPTFYAADTETMFRTEVGKAMKEAIEEVTKGCGSRITMSEEKVSELGSSIIETLKTLLR